MIKGRLCPSEDWREPLLKAMVQGRDIESNLPSKMKEFLKINESLLLRGAEGLLLRCVSR